MKCLLDGDCLRYEVGFAAQMPDPITGEVVIRDFDFCSSLLDQRIAEINAECWGIEDPVIYLTNDRRLHKKVNKSLKKEGKAEIEFQPNFRDAVAKKKVYKGNRKAEKPFHFDNITAYLFANYHVEVAVGMEADDLMSIHQYERVKRGQLDTIICSRDKDLRITPGMHFSWPCGKQQQIGPIRVTEIGDLELRGGKKLVGTGLKFFYSQVITGDATDNYGGLPRGGPALAYKSLYDAETEAELFERVAGLYKDKFGETWREEMLEQCQLAWMIRELDEDGKIVPYKMFDEREAD